MRHGGSAFVRSSPGQGTEVELTMARAASGSRGTAGGDAR